MLQVSQQQNKEGCWPVSDSNKRHAASSQQQHNSSALTILVKLGKGLPAQLDLFFTEV